ncbi:MAG TPA: adenylate/guanylate cyclase domain-containing protein [Coriobacteriia bacterium]|nr:adenylate/guanylate cyclase domain-containing protein [Coriobacteriia bacterium]
MAINLSRRNDNLLRWLRAALIALATDVGLVGLHFAPAWGAAALALVAGLLSLASVDAGVLVAVGALALPMLATSPVVGVTFIVLAIVLLRYVGSNGGQPFFVIAVALAGAAFGPVWAAAALAGYILGAAEGALAAALAAAMVELFGVVAGRAAIGATVTGGVEDLLHLAKMPESLFAGGWISQTFGSVSSQTVTGVLTSFGKTEHVALLIAQPIVWACCAVLAGVIGHRLRSSKSALAFLAPAGAALLPGAAIVVLAPLFAAQVDIKSVTMAAVTSAVLAAAVAWVWDRAFPVEVLQAAPRKGMAAEDADVDELLSLIATAEERLASEHTVTATVMITDMKSFSRMTEEDGSMITAKAIQRHRDLLLPVIEKHGGHGKSTGGDGLVAAFSSNIAGVAAAAEMQLVLDEHNVTHDERDLSVRIGLADGEVVLDKNGRPFIGAALNLAARVMNLADGGQVFMSASVARSSKEQFELHSHGDFALKNIAEPVEVFELLWAEGQEPVDPRGAAGDQPE